MFKAEKMASTNTLGLSEHGEPEGQKGKSVQDCGERGGVELVVGALMSCCVSDLGCMRKGPWTFTELTVEFCISLKYLSEHLSSFLSQRHTSEICVL